MSLLSSSARHIGLSEEAKQYLTQWVRSASNPYPSKEMKAQLMAHCGIQHVQTLDQFLTKTRKELNLLFTKKQPVVDGMMDVNNPPVMHLQPASISMAAHRPGMSDKMKRSQEKSTKKSSKKRRRLHQNNESSQDSDDDDEEVISVYSDSSNDGGNLSSNASSPESANKDTDDNEKYCTAYRTVQVPNGVTEGQLFHVVIQGKSTNDSNNDVIGVKCPKGVKAGDTILIVEPGSSPPLSPQQIAEINEQRLLEGIDKDNAKWVAISFWKTVWPVLVEEGWWCKKETLYNFGFVTFYAPTAKTMSSDKYTLNQQYFESISAVLNFHTLSPALVHACYADAEKRKIKSVEGGSAAKAVAASPSRRNYAALDRWKYPNGIGELKHSRVGSNYHADNLPKAGTFAKTEDCCCILEPIMTVKQNDTVRPTWLEWANDDAFADEFHCKILETKKEFRPLAALIDKPIGFCLWYYYCKYKPSKKKYVVLKNLLRDSNHESGEHLDECVICDDGGGECEIRYSLKLPSLCFGTR